MEQAMSDMSLWALCASTPLILWIKVDHNVMMLSLILNYLQEKTEVLSGHENCLRI